MITLEEIQLKQRMTSNISPLVETFKHYTVQPKRITFDSLLDDIGNRLIQLSKDGAHVLHLNENGESEILELREYVRKFTGVFFACLDDELSEDDEVMSNEDEVMWEETEEGPMIDRILDKIIDERLETAIEDIKLIRKILGSHKLDKFIYVKEKKYDLV